jgi:hypothetical protein
LVKGGHPIHNEIIGNDANTLILWQEVFEHTIFFVLEEYPTKAYYGKCYSD